MDPVTATATAAIATTTTAPIAGYTPLIIAAVCIVFGAIACAIAQSRVIFQGLECIARQPEAAKDLRDSMVVGLAMIESLAIYCLLISLLIVIMKS